MEEQPMDLKDTQKGKRMKIIWLLFFLVSCTVSKKEIEVAQEICENHGGFLYIHLDPLFDKVVRCKNTQQFVSISRYLDMKKKNREGQL